MGCDAVVAIGKATKDGQTYFAHNNDGPLGLGHGLCRIPGRSFALGEKVKTQHLELPQVRQTCTVLACNAVGAWGYCHGVNEHRVAIAQAGIHTRLPAPQPGLLGTDLVRLGLERSHSARHAVDVVTDLIQRHGLGGSSYGSAESARDVSLLIADPQEAFALETAGQFWVLQEIQQVRATSNVCLIRQDWDRIAPGLASHAIGQGWWPEDGTKLDFAGAVSTDPMGHRSAMRRWGRATLMLEEQSGSIDVPFLRRVLSDHYEGLYSEVDPLQQPDRPVPLCQHPHDQGGPVTAASLVVRLTPRTDGPLLAWWAFGPPCCSVYFPILLEGEVPPAFSPGVDNCWSRMDLLERQLAHDEVRLAQTRAGFSRLQATFDQETEEFLAEAKNLLERQANDELERLAGSFMEHNVEQFDGVWQDLVERRRILRPQPSA